MPRSSGRTASLAHRLTELGVGPGDRVAIQAEKSVSGLLLYLATLRAGAVHLPLNPAYTAAEVRYFLEDSEPALFVGDPERGAGARRAETLDALVAGASEPEGRSRTWPARPTISPPSSTRPERPAAPRARC